MQTSSRNGCVPHPGVSVEFQAMAAPTRTHSDELAALYPQNPFCTPAFADAYQSTGVELWLFSVTESDKLATGSIGFLSRGRLSRVLEIRSLPVLKSPEVYWAGLRQFCRDHKITDLHLNTFGSPEAAIPSIGHEISRRRRTEYVLDLTNTKFRENFSSNHARNLRKALRAGLTVRASTEFAACRTHAAAVAQSLSRREARGEDVSTTDVERYAALTRAGAATIFQAVADSRVLSSVLVLMAAKGGYYHSAGTQPDGMRIGASHFLINTIAERLQAKEHQQFNLGGVDAEDGGLARFKAGFGATPIPLEAAQFQLSSRARSSLVAAARYFVSRVPGRFRSRVKTQSGYGFDAANGILCR